MFSVLKEATNKSTTPVNFHSRLSANSEKVLDGTKKDFYPWQARILFPFSEEYKEHLINGIYQPEKNHFEKKPTSEQPKFVYEQRTPLSEKSQQYSYSDVQNYLRTIRDIPTFSLEDMQKKKAKLPETVPLELVQEKTSVWQKLQRVLSAIGNYLSKHINFGTQLDGKAIRVPEGS